VSGKGSGRVSPTTYAPVGASGDRGRRQLGRRRPSGRTSL